MQRHMMQSTFSPNPITAKGTFFLSQFLKMSFLSMLSESRDYIQSIRAKTLKGGGGGGGVENQTSLLIFKYLDVFFSKKALFNEGVPTILQLVVAR